MTTPSRSGRHHGASPAAVRLGISITALLGAFGAGVAVLPTSFTGSGMSAETPAAAIAALAPVTGGGAPGVGTPAPADPPSAPAGAAPPTTKTNAGGENVARGQRNAAAVMNSWMNSDGHRANILNCSFETIGAGAARGVDGTIVWGQLFGR